MEKYIDLHTHSLCSDGSMTPTEVVEAAHKAGLSAIALSDHDTVAGVNEAIEAGTRLGVEVIPAIELSAASKTETHILGYFINTENEELKRGLAYAVRVREERELEVCEKLNAAGIDVTMDEVRSLAGSDVLCRAHFARIMVNKGYVKTVPEAFEKYLGSGKLAYSKKQAFTDEEAVKLIKSAGGIAFVAHLNQTKRTLPDLKEFLSRLKGVGLDGVEGYYTEYTDEMNRDYRALANELGLILSGGSDFHAAQKPHIKIGVGTGDLRIPYSVLEEMKRYREPPKA